MKFTPVSEEDDVALLIPKNEICKFEIYAAQDKISKATANPYIELSLKVFYKEKTTLVFDNLMSIREMAFKVRHCCQAIGISEKYNAGDLVPNDFLNKSGFLKIGIQKNDNNTYPPRNVVADYVKDGAKVDDATKEWGDDDVPF